MIKIIMGITLGWVDDSEGFTRETLVLVIIYILAWPLVEQVFTL